MTLTRQRFGILISIVVAGWWITTAINGLLPQLQILLLGGRIIIPTWFMRAILLIAIFAYGMRNRYRLYPSPVAFWWLVFFAYIFLEFFIHSMVEEVDASYLIQGSYQYYFLLMLVVFCHHLSGSIEDRWMTPILIVGFIPIGVLGVAQYIFYAPIVPVASIDGYFQVIAWQHWFYSGIRAFSIFRSATEFGHYSALVGGLLIAAWLRHGKVDLMRSIFVMLMLVLILASVYVSKARIAYLVAIATVMAAIWIAPRTRLTLSMLLLPLGFALAAYIVAVAAPQMVTAMGIRLEGLLFSDASLQYRWSAWTEFVNHWLGHGWVRALFGSGLVQGQGGQFGSEGSVLIDNAFIAIGYHIGIIGLLLWLTIIWKLWRYVLETAMHRQTALSLGIAAYWSTLPMSLMFSSAQPLYLLPLFLFLFEKEPVIQSALSPEDGRGLDPLAKSPA